MTLLLPTATLPWRLDAADKNNVVTYTTLLATSGTTMFQIATKLVSVPGNSCAGSSNGVAANMTGTAWANAAAAQVRGATTTTPNSWMIIEDSDGSQFLLSFVGSSDDVWRLSWSPGGLYTLAGTATHTPTATDEIGLQTANVSVIGAAAGNRVWHVWQTPDAKNFRVIIARAGNTIGAFGMETFNVNVGPAGTSILGPQVTFTPSPKWGFWYTRTNMGVTQLTAAYTAGRGGGAMAVIAGVPTVANLGASCRMTNGTAAYGSVNVATLQTGGTVAYALTPLGLGSQVSGAEGEAGDRYDWWIGKSTGVDADLYPGSNLIHVGVALVWPWPPLITPQWA